MYWPSPSDYQEVLKNPSSCFQAPDLRMGQVSLGVAGVPNATVGTYANVYQVSIGNQTWAIRCFLRQVSDQQRRYQLLKQHLTGFRPTNLVDFDYQAQGILVRAYWYPILKMSWVEGKTLNNFVEQSLNTPKQLLDLAIKWRALINNLHTAHIAHGDLQPSNIIVSPQGNLFLVDYDAMFNPLLRGEKSPELGSENFQHPQRTIDYFDETLDNFSALVTYLSLQALAYNPNLWSQFHNGNNLIFVGKDFQNPYQSPLFQQLKSCPDEAIRRLTSVLENACLGNPSMVPDFETLAISLPMAAVQTSGSSPHIIPNTVVETSPNVSIPTPQSMPANPQFAAPPTWQGAQSAFNPAPQQQIPNPQISNPMVANFNPNNPVGQVPLTPQVKPSSPIWLKLLALASSFVAFFSLAFSLYQSQRYRKELYYVREDLYSVQSQLREEKAKREQLEREKVELESLLSRRNDKDANSQILAQFFKDAVLGTGKIDSIGAKVDSLKFFEGGFEGVDRALRRYSQNFGTDSSRFIYWELNLSHPIHTVRENFEVQTKWYKNGVLWTEGNLKTYVEPSWATSYHNDGKGWATITNNWEPGTYRVELYVDGKMIVQGMFSMVAK
jgi:serine/threonine protein kinase